MGLNRETGYVLICSDCKCVVTAARNKRPDDICIQAGCPGVLREMTDAEKIDEARKWGVQV